MRPNEEPKSEKTHFYPTESDRVNQCSYDKIQNMTIDTRYQDLSLNATEYEV